MPEDRQRTDAVRAAPNLLRPLAHPTLIASVSGCMIVIVIAFGFLVSAGPSSDSWELSFLQFLSSNHTSFASAVSLGIAWLFSPPIAITLSLIAGALVALVTRSPGRTATFLLMIAAVWAGSEVIKWLVHRARPDGALLADPLALEHGFSYPSGHTCFTAALALAVIFLARDNRPRLVLLSVIGALATVLVAFSRMYLGVHYPTDVMAAIVYSAAAAALFLVIWLGMLLPRIPWLRT
ncbi:phosphatase PAP2 family protein [Rathayibacter soli]|uniref:phosphatase PAP2 family protein n=1 Tax=Rathayibacter soli TaxID=3144168 RepID=UPI0027E5BCFB|nr:phosphatase PAP2 family protein [Glaciibacter superstes]